MTGIDVSAGGKVSTYPTLGAEVIMFITETKESYRVNSLIFTLIPLIEIEP